MRYLCLCIAFVLAGPTGCSHPYGGKPEKLKRPREKEAPAGARDNKMVWDDECRANFHDDKPPKRRRGRDSRKLARQADQLLVEADDKDGTERADLIGTAISKLRGALQKDQYGAEATYKMAVAYAMVAKRQCALLLLGRLNDLQRHVTPDVARQAELAIKRALREPAFDGFRKKADAAMGQ